MAQSDAFYQSLILEADAVIKQYGTTYQVRKRGAYNPDTMKNDPPGAPRDVSGVVADQQFARQLANGDAGWAATKSLILTADAVPEPTEEVNVDGQWFPLENVKPIKPADVVVIYMLDVTR